MLDRIMLTDKKIDYDKEQAAQRIARLKEDYQAIKADYMAIMAKNEYLIVENRALANERRVAREILAQLKARIDTLQTSVECLRRESEKLRNQINEDNKIPSDGDNADISSCVSADKSASANES